LAGATMVPAETVCMITRSLTHGHVAAVTAMARKLGWPALLGPARRQRDLVVALIVSRVVRPGSKLSTAACWPDTTLGADLGVAGASTDEVYAAMDWLADRQDKIEKQLAARHLGAEVNPARVGLVEPFSSWVGGRGGPCSTCRRPGWRGGAARWPRAATPATVRQASYRSSTGSSPIPRGGRWRCGCFPATPPIPPPSSRRSPLSGTRSGCSGS